MLDAPSTQLLDAIEQLVASNCCAAANGPLHKLREAVDLHLAQDDARVRVLTNAEGVDQSGKAIVQRLQDLKRSIASQDLMAAATCVADLREMFVYHSLQERA